MNAAIMSQVETRADNFTLVAITVNRFVDKTLIDSIDTVYAFVSSLFTNLKQVTIISFRAIF